MNEAQQNNLWQKFVASGLIHDYLMYKNACVKEEKPRETVH